MYEEITEEIGLIKQQQRKLSCKLSVYCEKERKAQWYHKAKQAKSKTTTVASDDGDYPSMLSPSSLLQSTRDGGRETSVEGEQDKMGKRW